MTSETELQNVRDAKELMILDLFDGWLNARPSADNVRAYLAELEPFDLDAVRRSVKQFRSGRVEGHNMDFPPSAPQLTANVREWQKALDARNDTGPEMHNGLIECDWGHGRVDLRGLTTAEQDQIIAAKGRAPDGRSLAYMPLADIRAALAQTDLAQVEGGKSFKVPALGRMT